MSKVYVSYFRSLVNNLIKNVDCGVFCWHVKLGHTDSQILVSCPTTHLCTFSEWSNDIIDGTVVEYRV